MTRNELSRMAMHIMAMPVNTKEYKRFMKEMTKRTMMSESSVLKLFSFRSAELPFDPTRVYAQRFVRRAVAMMK